MHGILDRILEKKERKKSLEEYEENIREFKKMMGKPEIRVSVELPEGYEDRKEEFLALEREEEFLKDVNRSLTRIVKKHLNRRKNK